MPEGGDADDHDNAGADRADENLQIPDTSSAKSRDVFITANGHLAMVEIRTAASSAVTPNLDISSKIANVTIPAASW